MERYTKALVSGAAVIYFGYWCMTRTTPSHDELLGRLPAEERRRLARSHDDRQAINQELMNQIQKNAASTKPVWQVDIEPSSIPLPPTPAPTTPASPVSPTVKPTAPK
ncbi:hypothetical protein CAOG_07713 [Capsaspora owczarzaki ATCC 30864]|uniref:Cytochrome b mRNA-processing protein 4 n=1 Tax=Capsaspora owczarzaki (strain ATCC 30864) TaxID=595528 RepID=A0A0D2VZJ2_CAPO3|nr:hypothetical protein CAOG_07713 [Capsaspora owczarzaki ATCC 30864]KJE97277.1 hypothetical protein CAOG_007713 [Capsaspora owczarzaki ATCC 30864]|eukprot:XP_004343587.1 hypothetical protein CAOG_07713 [Capsaspora owczarzaki ATCC 30864]